MRPRNLILEELAAEQARLAELESRHKEAQAKIELLRAQLTDSPATIPLSLPLSPTATAKAPDAPADKVRLFRSLFRGRADIFPTRFVSKRTDKPGYAPACSNKWEPRLCLLKAGGKCADCVNQAFIPVDDQVVVGHLRGRHVIGCYPLLEDETCWFLAVDFDKSSWKEDVTAFAATSRSLGVPAAIERSRSGNGAHAWFFFTAPVSANIARRMGCYLITETMTRRHELSMKSYDRLFPNQDTMPRGGFGNLIALPLQFEPRQQGNSVFVDESFDPYADQWAFVVHRKPLLEQWVAQLAMFFGIHDKQIGRIGGGQREPNGRLDVAMIQSLAHRDKVDDLVSGYGHVVVDECHHLPAISFERVLSEVRARYIAGLTATPQRRDGHHPIAEMQLGPVRYRIDAKGHAARRPFHHKLIVRETEFNLSTDSSSSGIQEIYRAIANDAARNTDILNDVISAIQEGRSPILLTERKDHVEFFAERLRGFVRHLIVLQGGMTTRARNRSVQQLASIPDTAERLILATGRYIGEGFDDARLDTLFLAMPISWKGTLIQYSGRLHRRHPPKTEVRIYDYVDRHVPMLLRMFEKRLATYRAIGYARGEAPLGLAEPVEERTVEYEPEALRHFEQDL